MAYVVLANCSLLLPIILGEDLFTKIKIDPMFFTYIGATIELIMFALIVGYRVTNLEEEKELISYTNYYS